MKYIEYKDNRISKLSLGTVQFGLDYGISNQTGKPTQKEVNEIIDFVIDSGINCFDTAQAYGNSEEVLGNAINKKEVLLISKLKSNIFRDNALLSLEDSLRNLKVDSLFSLLLHDSELLYNWKDEYSEKVVNLKENKKITYFGVSIYTSEEFDMAIENNNIDFIQIPFNIFDQRAIVDKWFEKAENSGKLIFVRSVYLQGLLLMDKEAVRKRLLLAVEYIEKLDLLCEKHQMTRNELALSFVDTVAKNSLLLFGCDNIKQAKENINNYNNLKLFRDEEITEIVEIFSDVSENIYNPTKW